MTRRCPRENHFPLKRASRMLVPQISFSANFHAIFRGRGLSRHSGATGSSSHLRLCPKTHMASKSTAMLCWSGGSGWSLVPWAAPWSEALSSSAVWALGSLPLPLPRRGLAYHMCDCDHPSASCSLQARGRLLPNCPGGKERGEHSSKAVLMLKP